MPVGAMECGEKIYALDVVDNRAVVGTRDRRVKLFKIMIKVSQARRQVGYWGNSPTEMNGLEAGKIRPLGTFVL